MLPIRALSLPVSYTHLDVYKRQDLITVEVIPAKTAPAKEKDKDGKETAAPAKAEPIVPFALCGGSGDSLVLTLQGGSNGSVRTVTADAFLGKDDGPGTVSYTHLSHRHVTGVRDGVLVLGHQILVLGDAHDGNFALFHIMMPSQWSISC